jgi:hypothetical protein
MKKMMTIMSLVFTTLSVTANAQIVDSLSSGAKVKCTAQHLFGNNPKDLLKKDMDVFYRIDLGQKKAQAYFKNPVTLGDYSFDGSCREEVCGLRIRDL